MKKTVLALLVVVLLAGAYFWYARQNARADSLPEYTTTTVAKGDVTQLVTATGILDAVLSVDVGSQVSGQITKLYADFNTRVTAGQKLAELDPASYQQKVRQAEASVASADASTVLAQLNADRTQELYDKSLMTRSDNDQAQAQLKQAKANLLTNQANLENARVDLSRCTIYSPIDGIVISKLTEVGKTVAASMNVPVLFTIDNDLAKMQITAAVAEADIGSVTEGQQVNFTVDAFPNRTFHGRIIQVRNAPQTTNNVVTYNTMIEVSNADLKLRPGMTANVSIIVASRPGALRLPNAALRVRVPEGLALANPPAAPGAAPAQPATAPAPSEGGGRGMMSSLSPENRQKMREIATELGIDFRNGPPTPEQRVQLRQRMVQAGIITAEQAAAMTERRPGDTTYVSRTVYRLPGGNRLAAPEAVTVKAGITDGIATEVVGDLKEGDLIITSISLPSAKTGGTQTSNPFGGGMRRF